MVLAILALQKNQKYDGCIEYDGGVLSDMGFVLYSSLNFDKIFLKFLKLLMSFATKLSSFPATQLEWIIIFKPAILWPKGFNTEHKIKVIH